MDWRKGPLRLFLVLWLAIAAITPAYIYTARASSSVLPALSKPVVKPEYKPDEILVKFKPVAAHPLLPEVLVEPAYQAAGIRQVKLEIASRGLYHLYLAPGSNLPLLIHKLQAESGVVYAEPNYIYHLFDLNQTTKNKAANVRTKQPRLEPNDPYRVGQYYLNTISAPQAWNLTTGKNLTVAVEDSGVRLDHPDLVGRIRSDGFNFVSNNYDVSDDLGHGTEVTGLIAANSNNNLGIAGISWAAQILPVKVADANGSIQADVAAKGIYYGVQHGARVLNLSYGGETSSATLADAVAYAQNYQVTVVAAAGNSPDGSPEYPAAFPGVVAVTATDQTDQLAFFDSYGPYVALSAPGLDIFTTTYGKNGSGDYGTHSGTSFSAPIVSGVVALMLSLNPYLRPAQVLETLRQTADKVYPSDSSYYYYYGAGRVNAWQALQYLSNLPVAPLPPDIRAQLIFSQHLTPNTTVRPGDNLTLAVAATNFGQGAASAAYLNVPLDPNLSLKYVQTQPGATQEWVTGIYSDHLNIQLGPVAPSSSVTFTVVYQVKPAATVGTNLSFQETGFWSDAGVGGTNLSNPVAVMVAATSTNHPTNFELAQALPTSGKIGQNFEIVSSAFAANEQVAVWLNLPDGSVQPLPPAQTDSKGKLDYLFSSGTQTQSGSYSLVAQGQGSQVEIVARFSLEKKQV